MTKTQVRELKAIVVVLTDRLNACPADDPLRVLAYRAQSLADEAMRASGDHPVRKVG